MRVPTLLLTVVLLGPTGGFFTAGMTLRDRAKLLTADSKLANTQWRLVSFVPQGAETPVAEGKAIILNFGSDGGAEGSGGCNSYRGRYREEEEQLSFSQLISTKRACADQKANQQEQQYFAALNSAKMFKLSGDRLTIFYGDGPKALNFVTNSPAKAAEDQCENTSSPVGLLTAFYDAVNSKDFERAYRYWENPPGNSQNFAQGYKDTTSVQLIVQLPARIDGAAGSIYAEIPTVIAARQRDGSERRFVGCYTMRKLNLSPSDVPKQEGWRIYKASVTPIPANAALTNLLAEACNK